MRFPVRSGHQNGHGLAELERIRCPVTGHWLLLRRAWPREPGHLLLEYFDGHGEAATVAGQWFGERARLHEVAGETAAAVGAAGLVAVLDDIGVVLQRGGADRRLGALAGVLRHPGTTLIVHRPERRAVLRVARPGATNYVKVVPAGRLPTPSDVCRGVRTPSVIRCERATGTVEYAELPGVSLHGLLGDPAPADSVVESAFRATGSLLRRLHAIPRPADMPCHDAESERVVTVRWLDLALAHGVLTPAEAESARAALAETGGLLAATEPPLTTTVVHRDLHDKQVLVEPDGEAGVLDLDTLAGGDPALDMANFLTHLELRSLQGLCSPDRARAAGTAFLDGYRPDGDLLTRLSGYAAATRLRLACVYAFRPRWKGVVGRLLAGEGSFEWTDDEIWPSGFALCPAAGGRIRP